MNLHSLKENTQHGTISFPLAFYEWDGSLGDWRVSLHWHDETEFIYFEKGTFTVWLNTRELLVEAPALMCIHAGELHSLTLPSGTAESAVVFNLNILSFEHYDAIQAKLLRPLLEGRLKMPFLINCDSPVFPQIIDCYRAIRQKIMQMSAQPGENELFKNALYLQIKTRLLELLAVLYENNCLVQVKEVQNKNEDQIENLKKVLRYINENYASPIRLKDLAALVSLNVQYFCRYFKENIGKTATEYINEIRIEKAAEALIETDDKIIVIAQNCGFESTGYFIRRFKSLKGATPSEYRSRAKKSK